jgi:hypothetical protein
MFAITWAAIAVNLSSFDRHGVLWGYVRSTYGLARERFSPLGSAGAPVLACCFLKLHGWPVRNHTVGRICDGLLKNGLLILDESPHSDSWQGCDTS